jgi:hypothetical protein
MHRLIMDHCFWCSHLVSFSCRHCQEPPWSRHDWTGWIGKWPEYLLVITTSWHTHTHLENRHKYNILVMSCQVAAKNLFQDICCCFYWPVYYNYCCMVRRRRNYKRKPVFLSHWPLLLHAVRIWNSKKKHLHKLVVFFLLLPFDSCFLGRWVD